MTAKWALRLTALTLASLFAGARAEAQVNGGFENPLAPPGGYNLYGTGSTFLGWTVVGAQGNVAIVDQAFTCCGMAFQPNSGAQWLDLTGISNTQTGVLQNMATSAGSQYNLSFWIGHADPSRGLGASSSIAVVIDAVNAGVFTNSASTPNALNWQQYFVSFTATSNSTAVEFYNGDPGSDHSNGLDDVVLSQVTATPEPASMLLLATGLAVLGIGARRKRID